MPVLLPITTKIEGSSVTGTSRSPYHDDDHTFTISRGSQSGVDAVAAAAAVMSKTNVDQSNLDVLEASSLLLSMSKQARSEVFKGKGSGRQQNGTVKKKTKKPKVVAPDEMTDDEDFDEDTSEASRFPNLEVNTSELEDEKVRQRTTISPRFEKTTARRPLQKAITLEELKLHFNKPIVDVAKEFGVCITLMKKICRKNGIKRWPHRLIRSLDKRIQNAELALQSATGAEYQRCQEQLVMLRRKLEAVFENPNIKMKETELDALDYHPGSASSSPSTPKSAIKPATPEASKPTPTLTHAVSISSILSPAPVSPRLTVEQQS